MSSSVDAYDEGQTPSLRTRRIAQALGRHRRWLWLGLCVFYLLSYNGRWRITPDGADYLIIAKSFAQTGQLAHPFDAADHVAPGFPVLMGYLIRFVGPEGFWAFDLAMLALVPINLALVYWLVRLYADADTAVTVTFLTAVTHGFFSSVFTMLADWPFVTGGFLYLVGVGYLDKYPGRWRVWGPLTLLGLAMSACLRTVFFVFLLGTIIGLPIHWARRPFPQRAWASTAMIAGIGVVLLMSWLSLGWMRGDTLMLIQSLTSQLPQTLRHVAVDGWWECLSYVLPRAFFGADLGPWPNLILSALLLGAVVNLARVNVIWSLVILGFVAQVVVLFSSTRHLLPALPLLVYAWWGLLCEIDRRAVQGAAPRRWAGRLVGGLFWIWVAANSAKSLDYLLEQQSRPFLTHYRHQRYLGLEQTRDAVRTHTPADSVILARRKWISPLMYLSDRLVVGKAAPAFVGGERPVFVVLPLGSEGQSLLDQHGWRVEHEQAIPIDPTGLPDLLLAPLHDAASGSIHGAPLEHEGVSVAPSQGAEL